MLPVLRVSAATKLPEYFTDAPLLQQPAHVNEVVLLQLVYNKS
jgi:hypothetical protein